MQRRTDFELRKISEGVFDKSTFITLHKLARGGYIDEIKSIISTGKESNIYHGIANKREIAIKIYSIEASDFRNREIYIKGDRRFHGWKNLRQLIYIWAQKEFRNLMRVNGKVRCPEPIKVENNVLVMEFIGRNGNPAPKIKDSLPKNPLRYFNKILQYIGIMYENGIVHGDLSEYNILDWKGPVLIDFSQGVLLDHPMAEELLERDVSNICRYFEKFGVECKKDEILRNIKRDDN